MGERREPALAVDAEPQPLPRRRAMAERAIKLRARGDQLDRPAGQLGGERAEHEGPFIRPLAPKPPPRNGQRTITLSGERPKICAKRNCRRRAPASACRSAACRPRTRRRCRAAPSRCDTAPGSRRSTSIFSAAAARPASTSPFSAIGGWPEPTIGGRIALVGVEPRARRLGLVDAAFSSAAPSVAASSVSAMTTAIG